MAFRVVEIANPTELHVRSGQLQIEQEGGIVLIPLEDIDVITCIGSEIRFSSMGLTKLAEYDIVIQCLDNKYIPKSIITPNNSNSRQALVINKQIRMRKDRAEELWRQIVIGKISNQSRVLSILGLRGAEDIAEYVSDVILMDATNREGVAAKEYFGYFHPGLSRECDEPMNSCLNYGYAVIRNSIIKSANASGFLMCWGIFHKNQYNGFNLADDLIEPWRPMVDLVAHKVVGSNTLLTKAQRKSLSDVLNNACIIDGKKTTVMAGIDVMIDSFRRYVVEDSEEDILLPTVLPIETIGLVTE